MQTILLPNTLLDSSVELDTSEFFGWCQSYRDGSLWNEARWAHLRRNALYFCASPKAKTPLHKVALKDLQVNRVSYTIDTKEYLGFQFIDARNDNSNIAFYPQGGGYDITRWEEAFKQSNAFLINSPTHPEIRNSHPPLAPSNAIVEAKELLQVVNDSQKHLAEKNLEKSIEKSSRNSPRKFSGNGHLSPHRKSSKNQPKPNSTLLTIIDKLVKENTFLKSQHKPEKLEKRTNYDEEKKNSLEEIINKTLTLCPIFDHYCSHLLEITNNICLTPHCPKPSPPLTSMDTTLPLSKQRLSTHFRKSVLQQTSFYSQVQLASPLLSSPLPSQNPFSFTKYYELLIQSHTVLNRLFANLILLFLPLNASSPPLSSLSPLSSFSPLVPLPSSPTHSLSISIQDDISALETLIRGLLQEDTASLLQKECCSQYAFITEAIRSEVLPSLASAKEMIQNEGDWYIASDWSFGESFRVYFAHQYINNLSLILLTLLDKSSTMRMDEEREGLRRTIGGEDDQSNGGDRNREGGRETKGEERENRKGRWTDGEERKEERDKIREERRVMFEDVNELRESLRKSESIPESLGRKMLDTISQWQRDSAAKGSNRWDKEEREEIRESEGGNRTLYSSRKEKEWEGEEEDPCRYSLVTHSPSLPRESRKSRLNRIKEEKMPSDDGYRYYGRNIREENEEREKPREKEKMVVFNEEKQREYYDSYNHRFSYFSQELSLDDYSEPILTGPSKKAFDSKFHFVHSDGHSSVLPPSQFPNTSPSISPLLAPKANELSSPSPTLAIENDSLYAKPIVAKEENGYYGKSYPPSISLPPPTVSSPYSAVPSLPLGVSAPSPALNSSLPLAVSPIASTSPIPRSPHVPPMSTLNSKPPAPPRIAPAPPIPLSTVAAPVPSTRPPPPTRPPVSLETVPLSSSVNNSQLQGTIAKPAQILSRSNMSLQKSNESVIALGNGEKWQEGQTPIVAKYPLEREGEKDTKNKEEAKEKDAEQEKSDHSVYDYTDEEDEYDDDEEDGETETEYTLPRPAPVNTHTY